LEEKQTNKTSKQKESNKQKASQLNQQ